jgi:hypothetical protein
MTAHVRRARGLSLALFFYFPFKREKKPFVVVEARGYVGNPEGCPSPVVNAKRCPSERHIHSLGVANYRMYTYYI